MNALMTIVSVYALYAMTVLVLVLTVQKRDRFSTIAVSLSFPILLIVAIFAAFSSIAEPVPPCPHGLEEAEALVERNRQLMFDGPAREPNIAKTWKRRYAMSVEIQARKMRKFSLELQAHLATI